MPPVAHRGNSWQGYSCKRGHLGRLRRSKVTTKDDGEPWYPGDQRDRN
jgi:hypothetical protein